MKGTFHKPAAAAGEVTATELQQSIFNAPPSAAFASATTTTAPGTSAGPQTLKPPPGLGRDTDMDDARSPATSVAGEKRKREEEEEEEDSGSDVAMEEDSDDD